MKGEQIEQLNSLFVHPCRVIMAGPSESGKTSLIEKFLINNEYVFNEAPQRIVYCYKSWNDTFETFRNVRPSIEFIQGVPEIEMFSKHIRNFLILDDLMSECGKNEAIKGVFCVDSHHKNISVFLLVQNAFTPEKYFRTMSVNAKYMIILNNPRDRLQFYKLALQVEPENYQYMKECYYDAVVIKQYGYLFLDFCQTTHRLLKVQTNFCFKNPKCIIRDIYIPK